MAGLYKPKAVTAKAAMKNEKLAKVLTDALDSPIGSTKRAKAAGVFGSLAKHSMGAHDGKGGPGPAEQTNPYLDAGQQQQQQPAQEPPVPTPGETITAPEPVADPTRKSKFVPSIDAHIKAVQSAPSPEERREDLYQKNLATGPFDNDTMQAFFNAISPEGMFDVGSQGMGDKTNRLGQNLFPSADTRKEFFDLETKRRGLPKGMQSMEAADRVRYSYLASTYGVNLFREKPATPEDAGTLGQEQPASPGSVAAGETELPEYDTGLEFGPWSQEQAVERYNACIDGGESTSVCALRVEKTSGFDVLTTSMVNDPDTDSSSPSASAVMGLFQSEGEDALDTWYNSLDASGQDYYRNLYESVKGGMGAETWTMIMLRDKEGLAKILGVPVSELSNFPDSGLLSDQLIDLKDAVKAEFRLDEQLNRLVRAQNTDATIEGDLTSYIRGKDEYLGQIDKLLDEANEMSAYMDTSNPNVAKRMGNYGAYLTILKGRQNLRYTDFLTQSIDQHNAKLQRMESLYNLSSSQAQEEYKDLSTVTTEDYDRIVTSLDSMYNNVAAQRQVIQNSQIHAINMAKSQSSIMLDVINASKITAANKKALNEDGEEYDDADPDAFRSLWLNEDGGYTTTDPSVIMQYAIADNKDPVSALRTFYTDQVTELSSDISSTGNARQAVADFSSSVLQLDGATDPEIRAIGESAFLAMESSVYQGIVDYISGQESRIKDLRTAIFDVSGTGGNIISSWFRTIDKDRGKFVKEYEDSLGVDVAGSVYDSFKIKEQIAIQSGKVGAVDAVKDTFKNQAQGDADVMVGNVAGWTVTNVLPK